MRLTSPVVIVFSVLVWPLLAAFSQTPSAKKSDEKTAQVIDEARETYRKLRSYEFERTTTFVEKRDGKEPKEIAKLDFIAASDGATPQAKDSIVLPLNPDRFQFSAKVGENKYILVSNEVEGWWRGPEEDKTHKTGTGILNSRAISAHFLLPVHAFPFALLEEGVVQKARVVREEIIEVEGERRACLVIEGTMKATYFDEFESKRGKIADAIASGVLAIADLARGVAPPSPQVPRALGIDGMLNVLNRYLIFVDLRAEYKPKAAETQVTLWVDKTQHLLVKTTLSSTLRKLWIDEDKTPKQQEEEVQVTMTDSFTRLKINEEVPKEMFRFVPAVREEYSEAGDPLEGVLPRK
jgi:hypothetical protein